MRWETIHQHRGPSVAAVQGGPAGLPVPARELGQPLLRQPVHLRRDGHGATQRCGGDPHRPPTARRDEAPPPRTFGTFAAELGQSAHLSNCHPPPSGRSEKNARKLGSLRVSVRPLPPPQKTWLSAVSFQRQQPRRLSMPLRSGKRGGNQVLMNPVLQIHPKTVPAPVAWEVIPPLGMPSNVGFCKEFGLRAGA